MSWKNVSQAVGYARNPSPDPSYTPLWPDPLNSFIGSYEKCNRRSLVEASDHKRVMDEFTPTGLIPYSTISKLLTICPTVDACDPSNVVRVCADSFEHGIVFFLFFFCIFFPEVYLFSWYFLWVYFESVSCSVILRYCAQCVAHQKSHLLC